MKLYDDQLILVSGGAGFIGSCFVRYLNDRGMENIVIVDELGSTEKWKNLVGKRFFHCLEKDQLFPWLDDRDSDIEAIVHLGACSSTVETDASYLLRNNYQYSVRLAEWAMRYEKRFIYASSAATYGDGSNGFGDDHSQLSQLRPLNMYGLSKQMFDMWVLRQGVIDDVVGLKFFNVFGPNEYHKDRMASAITRLVPQALDEGIVRLFKSSEPEKYPDGGQQRDFAYVKDVVRIIHEFLTGDMAGIYNVGSGEASTWNSLASAVFKAIDRPERIEYIPMPDDLVGKYQNYTCADMLKTHQVIKSSATMISLEDAVIDYVREYLLPGRTW